MSRYIYMHPKEALEEELELMLKTFERRRFSYGLLWLLFLKAYITYWYRALRLKVRKI